MCAYSVLAQIVHCLLISDAEQRNVQRMVPSL
jgi:hypothetical protein